MRDRSFILVASVLAALFVGAGALFLYDQSRDDHIAPGVRVGGVPVGGLTATQARRRLNAALHEELTQPVVVRGEGHAFRLTPREARATYDLDGMVDAAVRRSRQGSIFARVWRDVTGERMNASLPADLHYSREEVNKFAARVDDKVSRKPVDAHLEFSGEGFSRVAGQDGLVVDGAKIRREVTAALTGRAPDRTVQVRGRRVKPKVLKAELASAYPQLIIINRSGYKLRFYRHLKLVKTYPIAVGMVGLETPAGLYHVQNKQVDPAWSVPNSPWAGSLAGQVIPGGAPNNPLKARWMGIYNGAGIHGTAETGSLGSAASHGCIRMRVPDVEELYDEVPLQTPVYIA